MADGGSGMCWCLRRCGKNQEVLLLPDGEEVTMGRGLGVTYQLKPTLCPLMISRTHCLFKQNARDEWTVTDNKSLNGVWRNKERLEPHKAYTLSEGTLIQLGVPPPNMESAEFEYILVREHLDKVSGSLIRPLPGKTKATRTKRKFPSEDADASGNEGPSNFSIPKFCRVSRDGEDSAKSLRTSHKQPKASGVEPELNDSVETDTVSPTQQQCCRSTLQLSRVRETMEEIRRLNVQIQEKQIEMQEKLNHPQESQLGSNSYLVVQKELQALRNQLSNEQEQHLQSVKELKEIFQEEQQSMGSQKQAEEEHLKEQLAQALQEHTQLMQELNRNKNDFEQIIQAKNKELQETKEEKEKVCAQKEEVLNHMNDVLDNELQCIICSEHFIEAVTLNCAHSFCSYCIKSWRKRKEECPICRQEILSETRSLVLDNCIDSMVDKLSPEMKNRRAALILERKEMVQAEESNPVLVVSDSSSFLSDTFYISSSSSDSDELGSDFWMVNEEEEYEESLFGCGTDELDSSDFESDDDDSFLIV
ncbi:hypothetical protein XELAEV_18026380mg [Xenopus laevis]|uniref:E3 ubiquitin-protein ligase RNF8 n=1 Tax=Xenopus laevis TaxID=8355 RepID=A0A974CVH7_XENLA|nr:hypothetical protein XELAEV_18026380mg [Xenopus laevis]